jgi:hypothetical protein
MLDAIALAVDFASIQVDDPASYAGEEVVDLEGVDDALPWQDFLKQAPELRRISLPVAEVVDTASDRLVRRYRERFVESSVRGDDGLVGVEDEDSRTVSTMSCAKTLRMSNIRNK